MRTFLSIICFSLTTILFAQKEVYIPLEWQSPEGLDYSFDRSGQSDNFVVFWGPLAGDDPTQASPDIAFDPQVILQTAEDLYKFYIDTIRFVNDDSGVIAQYKIILVMLHTWPNLEGWAFGGNYDGVVGAMWMHPHAALSGPTLAHEFAHTLQNYAWILNPGHGFIDSSYVGFFWETHAEFMALQRYPSVALEFDMARWLNTSSFHWSSTRHHYQAFVFLQLIKEKDGIEMINRMWNEALIGEHPLETYKRLKVMHQYDLNNLFAEHAMRNVTWDYEIGDLLRERESTIPPVFLHNKSILLERDSIADLYYADLSNAPMDYGYQYIRLYPDTSQHCAHPKIHVRALPWHLNGNNFDTGLRLGFVTVNQKGKPRYSPIFFHGQEVLFELEPDDEEIYLVVVGAPETHHNYAYENGIPRTYKFPYHLTIEGALPEGYQPGIRPRASVPGAPHSNGGGFVAATAFAASSAFVDVDAQILDNAQILDDVTISGNAIIRGNAIVRGHATVTDFAIVQDNSEVYDHAIVKGFSTIGESANVFGNSLIEDEARIHGNSRVYDSAHIHQRAQLFSTAVYSNAEVGGYAFCWGATLHGDVVLGGDAEFFSECSDGTYLQPEFAYGRHCDGLDDHFANQDVIRTATDSLQYNIFTLLCDTLYHNIFEEYLEFLCEGDTLYFGGDTLTASDTIFYEHIAASGIDSLVTLHLVVDSIRNTSITGDICPGNTIAFEGVTIHEGQYSIFIEDIGCGLWVHVNLTPYPVDTNLALHGDTLIALHPAVIIDWFDCATEEQIPGAAGASFVPESNGTYQARLITSEGCVVYTECVEVTTVSTNNPTEGEEWVLYPNPASGFLHIENKAVHHWNGQVVVADMQGKVWQKQQIHLTNTLQLDISTLPQGVYVLQLESTNGNVIPMYFVKLNSR